MPKKVSWTCSICGIEKAISNGWFIGFPYTLDPGVGRHPRVQPTYRVIAWDDAEAEAPGGGEVGREHLCGTNCLNIAIERHVHPTKQDKADKALSETSSVGTITAPPMYIQVQY